MRALICVPARIGSTRFPRKPLHPISGRSLLERVVQVARVAAKQTGSDFVVAVDHEEVAELCRHIGAPFVMTDPGHSSGTDRALAAAKAFGSHPEFVLNLQGDAPFTPPEHVAALIRAAEVRPGADVFTPVVRLDWDGLDTLRAHKKEHPFSGTTCVRRDDGTALWFSKNILPAIRKEEKLRETDALSPVFRHIGLYGYRIDALEEFTEIGLGYYEQLEGLEQLRFLENGMVVHAEEVAPPKLSMSGVDTPADAELAAQLIAKFGDPFDHLETGL
ncbi:manno-octulosonate cytidylyltransferase [Pseudovibrio sp. Tun.PSC04-5.I4]|uniref:3-deoxy-manno-octulosonate cytidylyltransferase family protein n=1 Tax=Pseudovibrio sp. Tun.PSC04-5.I4 TaxID=1798213 RepID=UPI000889E9D2|nr:manno-octulosonate cytidylyltransferase [Pseudovibrio sp. Tun.PSC04-5.I4]SDR36080.1 3-deoxy-manno-octulosonate cytidylyltransferase (CMP-KDO synthetase) [Pseudovibrio sp. Tun.PSC04-5.I4]